MKLHLIWDLDGTLVDSEHEIISTLQKALGVVGISLEDAVSPLRIGPPLPDMLRNSFPEKILDDEKRKEVVQVFRKIYNVSDFEDTLPFKGVEELLLDDGFVHHIITNKPRVATHRIIEKKGWSSRIVDVLTPDTLMETIGRAMKKVEMFRFFMENHPDANVVAIGDMATDAQCAKAIGIPAIGVLWGAGTREELIRAECDAIAGTTGELKTILGNYIINE